MLVLLPLAATATYILSFRRALGCWREAVILGAVTSGTVLVGLTELLSAVRLLTVWSVAISWSAALLIGLTIMWRRRAWPQLQWTAGGDRATVVLVGGLTLVLAILAGTALISPPNTWDSMTYHMARLIHWQDDASVAPYQTNILRQLYLQPGAEYLLLHLQLLSGGDRLAGLVQWGAMLGSLVGVTLLARELGACQSGVICALFVAASLPIGVLESTSTQNDYVAAFWIVCTAVFAIRVIGRCGARESWLDVLGLGAALGLALLTKATAYLFLLPMLVWFSITVARRSGARAVAPLLAIGFIALSLNLGFFVRNLQVFRSPTGPSDEGGPTLRYLNDAMTPALLTSNALRDAGLNLVATPFSAINVRAFNFVQLVHTGMDVDLNDRRTTWGTEVFAEQPVGLAFDENRASNPIQFVLLLGAFAGLWPLRKRLDPRVMWYAASLVCGFLLFAGVLRWQPWHTRLELPLFVLGAPLVGVVAERLAPRLALVVSGALVLSMLPWVVYNQARPLVGPRSIFLISRDDQYFTNRPGVRAPYEAALTVLRERGCSEIGFVSNQDGWEYPLWALGPPGLAIEHVGVSNVTSGLGPLAADSFSPCAIVAFGEAGSSQVLQSGGQTYRSSWSAGAGQDALALLTVDGL